MTKAKMTTKLPAPAMGWVLDLADGTRQYLRTTSRDIAFHYVRKLGATSARMWTKVDGTWFIEV